MAITMADLPVIPQATPRACEDCRFGDCEFSLKRVRLYLIVWRQAKLAGEPFDLVLRHRTRSSRAIDPWVRSNVPDREREERAQCIGWALEDIGRRFAIDLMNPWNAEKIASLLCPGRWDEAER